MAARYSRVDYRRFASILRSTIHNVVINGKLSPEETVRNIASAISYEFEKDSDMFSRQQFFAQANVNDPKEDE